MDDELMPAAGPAPTVVAVPAANDTSNDHAAASTDAPLPKKRKAERREKLRKTALCKHFDSPGGCPYPNCRFAHGRDEVAADEGNATLAAQRKFLREQVKTRLEERFQQQASAAEDKVARRGTMVRRLMSPN
jgi:hypothetical protein